MTVISELNETFPCGNSQAVEVSTQDGVEAIWAITFKPFSQSNHPLEECVREGHDTSYLTSHVQYMRGIDCKKFLLEIPYYRINLGIGHFLARQLVEFTLTRSGGYSVSSYLHDGNGKYLESKPFGSYSPGMSRADLTVDMMYAFSEEAEERLAIEKPAQLSIAPQLLPCMTAIRHRPDSATLEVMLSKKPGFWNAWLVSHQNKCPMCCTMIPLPKAQSQNQRRTAFVPGSSSPGASRTAGSGTQPTTPLIPQPSGLASHVTSSQLPATSTSSPASSSTQSGNGYESTRRVAGSALKAGRLPPTSPGFDRDKIMADIESIWDDEPTLGRNVGTSSRPKWVAKKGSKK